MQVVWSKKYIEQKSLLFTAPRGEKTRMKRVACRTWKVSQ